jgi:hypothetical protein
MVKKQRKDRQLMVQHRIKATFIFGVLTLLLPLTIPTAYAEPPVESSDCLAYAYTVSEDHYFLLKSNASGFGTNITVQHNCESINVFIDGNFSVSAGNNSFIFYLEPGIHNLTIQTPNENISIYNFQVYPNRLDWAFDFEQWQLRNYDFNEYVELSASLAKANWASILSIVIVFILVTYVHWNLINSYVDRNFCEEVIK